MTSPSGVIHSPNYPQKYERNVTCEWSISVEDNYAVVLTFEDVDMYRSNCSDNYIKVSYADGFAKDDGEFLGI